MHLEEVYFIMLRGTFFCLNLDTNKCHKSPNGTNEIYKE